MCITHIIVCTASRPKSFTYNSIRHFIKKIGEEEENNLMMRSITIIIFLDYILISWESLKTFSFVSRLRLKLRSNKILKGTCWVMKCFWNSLWFNQLTVTLAIQFHGNSLFTGPPRERVAESKHTPKKK